MLCTSHTADPCLALHEARQRTKVLVTRRCSMLLSWRQGVNGKRIKWISSKEALRSGTPTVPVCPKTVLLEAVLFDLLGQPISVHAEDLGGLPHLSLSMAEDFGHVSRFPFLQRCQRCPGF